MLYFAWVRAHELFDHRAHLRHDEDIFHLKLVHQEGQPAVLDLKVSNPYINNPERERSCGILSYQKSHTDEAVCLFHGKLLSQSCTHGEHFFIFSLIAENYNLQEQWADFKKEEKESCETDWAALQEQLDPVKKQEKEDFQKEWPTLSSNLKRDPFYHPLCDDGKLETLIASQPLCFYWDRCSAKLSFSHAFKGAKEWDLTPDYDPRTLDYAQKEPLHSVSTFLSAQWIQTLTGHKDIAPDIEAHFPARKVSTYTPKALTQSWPKTGHSIGNSGYYVLHSALEEREKVPFKNHTERYTQALSLESQLATQNKKTRLLAYRSWFDASLWVGYAYRQKRKENMQFNLKTSLPNSITSTKTEHIKIPLKKIVQYEDLPQIRPMSVYKKDYVAQHKGKVYQALCDHALRFNFEQEYWKEVPEKSSHLFLSLQNSFFLTDQGRKVFEHALERAKTALTWGTRCTFLSVRGPLSQWANVTLDDTALLKDDRLPGGKFAGKVIKYTLTADGNTSCPYVELSIAGRIGVIPPLPQLPEPTPCYAIGYTDYPKEGFLPYQLYTNMYCTVRGIAYKEFYDQKEEDPLEFLIHSQLSHVVRHISVHNGPAEQESHLHTLQNKLITAEELKNRETKIFIDFIPIRSVDQLTQTFNPQIMSLWFDPS